MKVRMGLGLPLFNTASCLHCDAAQANLIPSPDYGLNSYYSPQLSVKLGVTSIEAYGHGNVTTVSKFGLSGISWNGVLE
jgi:hypothetical protein